MKYELIVHIWGKEAAGRVFWYLTIGLVVFPLVCDWPLSPTSSLDVWLSLSEALFRTSVVERQERSVSDVARRP